MSRDRFPDGVAEQLNWYVYRLIDPRNGETFYVGKGQGNRLFAHARGLEVVKKCELLTSKSQRIKEIQAAGLEVGHVVHRHRLSTEDRAYEVEAAVIDAYPGLTNLVNGYGSGEYGSRHVEEIINEYAGEEFQVKEDLMLISIGVYYYKRESAYDAVCYAWGVNRDRAEKHKLVLAHVKGLVDGAYRPEKWLPATSENFPKLASRYEDFEELPQLFGFVGEPADVWEDYFGKRVPERFIGSRIAFRYLKHGM